MNDYAFSPNDYRSYLAHYGILGQHWGRRRWQNEDGTLTPEGREHYGIKMQRLNDQRDKIQARVDKVVAKVSTPRMARLEAKRLDLETKKARYAVDAKRGEYALMTGNNPRRREQKAMNQTLKLDRKLYNITKKLNAPAAKIAKMEAKAVKVDAQIKDILDRYGDQLPEASNATKNQGHKFVESILDR